MGSNPAAPIHKSKWGWNLVHVVGGDGFHPYLLETGKAVAWLEPVHLASHDRSVLSPEPGYDLVKEFETRGCVVPLGDAAGSVAEELAGVSSVSLMGLDECGRSLAKKLHGMIDPSFLLEVDIIALNGIDFGTLPIGFQDITDPRFARFSHENPIPFPSSILLEELSRLRPE